MLAKPARSRRGVQTLVTATVPAPVGGLNAIDPISAMPKEDASYLVNWWPTPYDVQIRKGWMQWGTGTGSVTSLCPYNTPTGANKLFAASADTVWDVSTAGAGSSVATGKTSGYWQSINFSNSAGTWLYMFNGADKPLLYNGTTWVAIDGASTPAITGVTTTTLISATVHMNRIWMVAVNSLVTWYLDALAVGGTAHAFDLRSVFKRGGYVMAATNWTIDAGQGMDDHLVFVTNKGEAAVYKGTDVSDATKWALVGVWQLGEPMGRRCFISYGGDVAYLSKSGVELLSAALISTRVNTSKALSYKVAALVSDDTTAYEANQGWQMLLCPRHNMLMVNVPSSPAHQYAMNTISKSWTRFEAVNAQCWALFNDEPYFGYSSGVGKFWVGWSDNQDTSGTNGQNINYDALQSFQSFGNDAQKKRFTLVRPTIQAQNIPGLKYIVNTDFNPSQPTATPSYGSTGATPLWGTSVWGAFKWAGGKYLLTEWQAANAVGYTAALFLRGASKDTYVRWSATSMAFERGGVM